MGKLKVLGKVMLCILLSCIMLCSCAKSEEPVFKANREETFDETANKYWRKTKLVLEEIEDFNIAYFDVNQNDALSKYMYVNVSEKSTQEVMGVSRVDLTQYCSILVDKLVEDATVNMVDIAIAYTVGTYDNQLWYFILNSYTDTLTGNKVVNIIGLQDSGCDHFVVMDFGIEAKEEDINTDVVYEFLQTYQLRWTVEDVI